MPPRHQLADRRRFLGYSQEALAHALGVSVSSVAHWERGTYAPLARHRRPLAEKLEVTLPELEILLAADGQGTVSPNGHVVPEWLTLYASLEQGASELYAFEPITVHALLQTRDYATAVERSSHRPVTDYEVAQRAEARIARQRVLDRNPNPLQLSVVLDESVLRRVTGEDAVMAAQLEHLAEIASRPNVRLQIAPCDGRLHCASFGAFQLLTSPGSPTPYMACGLDMTGFTYYDSPQAVEEHAAMFEHLTTVAHSPSESTDLILTTARSYR